MLLNVRFHQKYDNIATIFMLGFASLVTLGIIFAFIFVVVLLSANIIGAVDITTVIAGTVVINFLSWLVSPFFMDLMFRIFYKTKRLDIAELETKSQRLAGFIKKICEKYNLKIPKLRLILDDNPTAFTFGSGAFNARLCFSEGLFTYLDDDEIEAVIGHELGHIRRRDFIIMTIAATGVQILYELSQFFIRSRKGGKGRDKGNLVWLGLIAYAFYFIGVYLLLFLSRTREYGADEFSAHEIENPDALSRALVKVAYGIIAKPDYEHEKRLLSATRALGPYDSLAARNLGTAFESSKKDWHAVSKVLAYDLISPWAKILQLQSTHPLTGKRILKLNEMAKNKGRHVSIETDVIKTMPVDREKLYKGFALGVFIHFLPWILPLVILIAGAIQKDPAVFAWIPAALGLSLLIKTLYKYPETAPEKITTLDALTDLYASPVRGRMYAMEGTVIGRGEAGARLSEDLMMQDSKGLIYLNYESAFAFIGNLIFAFNKVRRLLGQKVTATGWFFRGVGHHLDLKEMHEDGTQIKSHPKLWSIVFAVILIAVSFYLQQRAVGVNLLSF